MSENMGQSGIFTRNFAADCAFATRRWLARAPLQWNHRLPEAGKSKVELPYHFLGDHTTLKKNLKSGIYQ